MYAFMIESHNKSEKLISDLNSANTRIGLLEKKSDEHDTLITLLFNKVDMLEKQVKRQNEDHLDLKVRSMDHNIVISGKSTELAEPVRDPRDKRDRPVDDCKAIVESIIKNKLGLGLNVVRAHRLGAPNSNNRARPIVARLYSREAVRDIMRNTRKLAGSDIFINPQYPQATDERRQFIQSYRKESVDSGKRAKVAIDKLYIDNVLRDDLLAPVLPPSNAILDLPEPQVSDVKSNSHVKLQLSLVDSSSMEEVRAALDATSLTSNTAPDNIVYAYRLFDDNKTIRNYDSGADPGVGHRLIKIMDQKELIDKTAVLYLWYGKSQSQTGSKMKGNDFYDILNELMDDLTL